MNFHLPFSELLAERFSQLCLNGPNWPYCLASNSEEGRWKFIFSSVLQCPYYMFSDFIVLHLVAICKGIIVVLGNCVLYFLKAVTSRIYPSASWIQLLEFNLRQISNVKVMEIGLTINGPWHYWHTQSTFKKSN